jgi:hypothetical protein
VAVDVGVMCTPGGHIGGRLHCMPLMLRFKNAG